MTTSHRLVTISLLGEATIPSPIEVTVPDDVTVPYRLGGDPPQPALDDLAFEAAGPRARLFFEPSRVRAGIVTCGGLCPGLNNVIRSLFMALWHTYGVRSILGFRGGYRGLDPSRSPEPFDLTPELVRDIHRFGGTLLGTSRGPVDVGIAVDNLVRRQVDILFTIGGDGTQRGAAALYEEARRRHHHLAVVGIPKTIDNDVAFVSRTFGYQTAVEEAAHVLEGAHAEARSVERGVALVKLMGRQAGFIAAGAAVASQDVNFVLVPEVPFALEGPGGFFVALERRVARRNHAVVVVAEGAGQDLVPRDPSARDASGNPKLGDVGPFLRDRIERYFAEKGAPVQMRYIDPSYIVRSRRADAEDAILCDTFARYAVHAAMAGKTGLVIGLVNDHFVHVPIDLLTTQPPKRIDPTGAVWQSVLSSTGQPRYFS